MNTRIRPFTDADAPAVDELYTRCHPTWPSKPTGWWWGHPTLVLVGRDGQLIGSTSCSIAMAPAAELIRLLTHDRAEIGWGHGVYVDPAWRGHGYGWELADARHRRLRGLGVEFFIGMTQPLNIAMIAIFERQKLLRGALVPKAYPDGGPGLTYSGGIV